MGNMLEQMKKAQQLVQVEAAQVQTELAQTDFEGYSADETVRVVMSGNQEPRSVDFTDEALEQGPDVSKLPYFMAAWPYGEHCTHEYERSFHCSFGSVTCLLSNVLHFSDNDEYDCNNALC